MICPFRRGFLGMSKKCTTKCALRMRNGDKEFCAFGMHAVAVILQADQAGVEFVGLQASDVTVQGELEK